MCLHQKYRWKLVLFNMFKPYSRFLTDRSNAVLLLWILFVICVSCLSLVIVTFPYGVLVLVRYLNASIPDICFLPYLLSVTYKSLLRLSSN